MSAWVDQGLMNKIQQNKLVFFETRDSGEISLALKNYFKVLANCVSLCAPAVYMGTVCALCTTLCSCCVYGDCVCCVYHSVLLLCMRSWQCILCAFPFLGM